MLIYPEMFCAMRFINDERYKKDKDGVPVVAEIKTITESYRQNSVTVLDTYKNANTSPVMQN